MKRKAGRIGIASASKAAVAGVVPAWGFESLAFLWRGARAVSGRPAKAKPSSRARRFESCSLRDCAGCSLTVERGTVAPTTAVRLRSSRPWVRSSNWIERRIPIPAVVGSSPTAPAHDGVAQLVERVPVKHEGAGSIPATVAMCPCPNWQRSRSQKPEDPGPNPGGHTMREYPNWKRGSVEGRFSVGSNPTSRTVWEAS